MSNYEELYFKLAGDLANTIDTLDKLSNKLKDCLCEAEDAYINEKERDTTK